MAASKRVGAGAPVKLAVAGLWHLGSVTAACCARHFHTTGIDFDPENIARLNSGKAPLFEPGLDDLISVGLQSGQLRFSTEPVPCDVLWLTFDTPVDDNDESDVEFVLSRARKLIPAARLVLISSQLPVGTCAKLELEFPGIAFAYSPENLRLGQAIAAFEEPDRIVTGVRNEGAKEILSALFAPFCANIIWMKTESAEMVKHGLNSFLALSIAFINEVAALCEKSGADAREVARGLKSDVRIGPRAYLSPGGAFAGGTLARDLVSLTHLGEAAGERLTLIPSIKQSNDWHRGWALRKLREKLGTLGGRRVAVLGLTYTPGTDTLRRSQAVELCRELEAEGALVLSFDPLARNLTGGAEHAVQGAEAVVISTEWPEFRSLDWQRLGKGRLVLDANGFLQAEMDGSGADYVRVGVAR